MAVPKSKEDEELPQVPPEPVMFLLRNSLAPWGSWKELTRVMPWRVWWSQETGQGEAAPSGEVGLSRVCGGLTTWIFSSPSCGLMLLL